MISLSHLSNSALELSLKDLVQKERKLLHLILEHIREIDSRKLYLEKAYSSIFEYLVKELGYSNSSAMRRLEAARLLREVPQIAEGIQKGSLNLSQIGELSRGIKEKEKTGAKISAVQKQDLVSVIAGKTAQETQHEVARIFDLPVKDYDSQRVQKDESVRLEFTLSKEQYEKLLMCKDLAAHSLLQKNGCVSLNDVIEFLANQYLDEKLKKPSTKLSVLKSVSSRDLIPGSFSADSDSLNISAELTAFKLPMQNDMQHSKTAILTTDSEVKRKSVTPKFRRLIFERDRCCQYVDKRTGRKCRSSFALQVDHKTSQCAGGGNSLANLQLLCAQHNRVKYLKEANIS
ncbi:HNH endonuclease [Bdellovibrio reynosensis]|uniref:HNH endonuclease n=1 Tax=Bdellovibrio reynosensis TaxID=2835041 RepID=A0ABY4CAL0_9BACT|nr:HNH endonuclease signature motif containing protein [Bdellovibrio reynosensis]UOF01962.1 HNH endonuclease [Bdellovibrio reynosensis]